MAMTVTGAAIVLDAVDHAIVATAGAVQPFQA